MPHDKEHLEDLLPFDPSLLAPKSEENRSDSLELLPLDMGVDDGTMLPFDPLAVSPSIDQNLIKTVEEAEELVIIPSLSEVYEEVIRGLRITITGIRAGGTAFEREAQERARFNEQQLDLFRGLIPDLSPGFEETLENRVRRAELDAVEANKFQLQLATDELVQKGIPPESLGGGMVRDLTRIASYAAITIPLLRGAGLGSITSSIGGAALADLAAFDGDEPRLANLLATIDQPDFSRAVFEYMEADPSDPLVEQKFKQAVEGLLLGGVGEGLGRLIGGGYHLVRGARRKLLGRKIGSGPGTSPIPRTGSKNPEVVGLENQIDNQATDLMQGRFGDEALPKVTKVKSGTQTPAEFTLEEVTRIFQAKIHELDVGNLLTPKQIAEKTISFRDAFSKQLDIPSLDRQKAEQLFQALEANSRAIEAAMKRSLPERAKVMKNDFINNIVDRSGTLKRELLKQGGAEGRVSVMMLELAQGASTAAHKYYRDAWKQVFGVRKPLGIHTGMPKELHDKLNRVIMVRRIKEIKSYDPNWQPPIDLAGKRTKGGKTTFTDWENELKYMRINYGEEAWTDLTARADLFFSETKKSLDVLHKAGVISDDELIRLGRFEYSPIQFLDEVDPIIMRHGQGAKAISVPSSGIPKLGRGDENVILENADAFLSQIITRVHSRAARNRANQALYNTAEKTPDNGTVSLGRINEKTGSLDFNKPPKEGDWAQISVMFDGKPKKMYLRRDMVDQWNASPIATHWAVGAFSGATLIRPLATGINPEFVLSNFPRDLMYSWLTAGEGSLYSTNMIRAMGEMGVDLKATFKDAWKREGAFIDYIDEGGGMNLMTHGAQESKRLPVHAVSRIGRLSSELQHILGYLNETSEIWVRLMNRNRALKQGIAEGLNPTDAALNATWEARRYLDFSQGGGWTKRVDAAMPYTNAAVQGMRGTLRAASKNPKMFAAKVAQGMSVFGGMWMANNYVNPEAWKQIPAYIRNRYLVITTPYYRTDLEGNRRYMYFKMPIDHSTMPIKAATDAMFERVFNGQVPSGTTMETIRTLTSPVPGVSSLPPTLNAMVALWANHDWWRDEKVWKGQEGIPLQLERTLTGERPTSRIAEEFGGLIGPSVQGVEGLEQLSSPARLEVAFKSFVPQNIYTDLVGYLTKEAIEVLTDDERTEIYETIQQQFKNAPFGRRLIGETHPLVASVDAIKQSVMEALGERVPLIEELDLIVQNTIQDHGDFRSSDINKMTQWIKQQDPLAQQALANRFSNAVQLHKIFKHIDVGSLPGMLPRDGWVWISSAPPKARAAMIVNELADAKEDLQSDLPEEVNVGRRKLRAINQMLRVMPGFNLKKSPEFALALRREAEARGVSLPN